MTKNNLACTMLYSYSFILSLISKHLHNEGKGGERREEREKERGERKRE